MKLGWMGRLKVAGESAFIAAESSRSRAESNRGHVTNRRRLERGGRERRGRCRSVFAFIFTPKNRWGEKVKDEKADERLPERRLIAGCKGG
ncbi:MAG TPA: hypothetical protein VEO95_13345 [Chthoniobacteraceae bacterium]|nr:hypothetical protein [Chthoniobacteraceae bacterium]